MPIKFQRPENLPEDIPIYHVSCPDHNADLLLKITALGSNKIAVIPTYKEVVADLIPNYFGEIFKEGKNFKLRILLVEESKMKIMFRSFILPVISRLNHC